MNDFDFSAHNESWVGSLGGQTFYVGPDALCENLQNIVEDTELRKVAVFFSGSASRAGLDSRIESLLKGRVTITFNDVPAHSPAVYTAKAVERLADIGGVDGIIAVGGGSVSDTAKGVALSYAEGQPIESLCSTYSVSEGLLQPVLLEKKVPIIAVPTTLSGAEITPGGGVKTPEGVKRIFWDTDLKANHIIYDTKLLSAVPRSVLAPSGMNALAHCVEALYSSARTPLTDALSVAGIEKLSDSLPSHNDVLCMSDLATGAVLAGIVLGEAGACLHHAICHGLGAYLGVGHGIANSIILSHAVRFNLESENRGFDLIAGALGLTSVKDIPSAIDDIRRWSGGPGRLRDVGLDKEDLGVVAEHTMADRGLNFNPRRITHPSDVLEILLAAW